MPEPAPQVEPFQDTIEQIRGWEVQTDSDGKALDAPVSMRGTVTEVKEPANRPSPQGGTFKVYRFTIEHKGRMAVEWTSSNTELNVGDEVTLDLKNERGGPGTVRRSFSGTKRVNIEGQWVDDPEGGQEWKSILKVSSQALQVVARTGPGSLARTSGAQSASPAAQGTGSAMSDLEHAARLRFHTRANILDFLDLVEMDIATLVADAPPGLLATIFDGARRNAVTTMIAVTDERCAVFVAGSETIDPTAAPPPAQSTDEPDHVKPQNQQGAPEGGYDKPGDDDDIPFASPSFEPEPDEPPVP